MIKGIVLAGGLGTRLHPITKGISKQLLPVYDKPMIYYPISVLMMAGIREVLIISTPDDLGGFKKLLGDGSDLGMSFVYAEQAKPEGLAQAFIIGASFIQTDPVCLILGDNIFYGSGLQEKMQRACELASKRDDPKATVFGYYVNNPGRYGVAEFNAENKVISIEEKPLEPKSNYAITGLYFYPNSVIEIAKTIEPSARGELEITSVNERFLQQNELHCELLERGYAWLDTGTIDALSQASDFVEVIEKRQGLKVAALEEVAYEMGFITKEEAIKLAEALEHSAYGQYLIERFK